MSETETSQVPVEDDPYGPLTDDIAERLVAGGAALVTFVSRLAAVDLAALTAQRADHIVDDAAATFRWAALRDEIDMDRIAVLGAGSGAIIAATLAGRTDRVAGLCLIAPATAEELLNGPPSASNGRADAFDESLRDLHAVDEAAAFDRPTLIIGGAADRRTDTGGCGRYMNRIEDADHRAEYVLVARADAEFSDDSTRTTCAELVCGFLAGLPALAPRPPAS
jgi:acetyl esterase/lipase